MTSTTSVVTSRLFDGSALLIELGPPPGNILDRAMIQDLSAELSSASKNLDLKAIVIRGAGEHFSYGASVVEHLPDQVGEMLSEFHALLNLMNSLPLPPVIAAVRGRCLGGGFELALACDHILVEEGAEMGCPEIRLGVFPPAAAALLPLRVSAAKSSLILSTAQLLSGDEAVRLGVAEVQVETGTLDDAVEVWVTDRFNELSAAALRQTRKACRHPWRLVCEQVLPELERQYLRETMSTDDAMEGLQAFLEKRHPKWSNR